MSGTAESPDQAPGNQQQQEFDLIGATAGTILLTASISASSQKRFTLQADGGFSVYDASGNVTLTWDNVNLVCKLIRNDAIIATPSLLIEQDGAGNPFQLFNAGAAANSWAQGIDHADSDKWKVSYGTAGNAALGTNDFFTIKTNGECRCPQWLNVGTVISAAIQGDFAAGLAGSNGFHIKSGVFKVFASSGSGINIDTLSVGQQINLIFNDNNVQKWSLYKSAGNDIKFFNHGLSADALSIAIATSNVTFAVAGIFPAGLATAPSVVINGSQTGFFSISTSSIDLSCSGTSAYRFAATAFSLLSNSASITMGASVDVVLARDTAAVLALKNGNTAQTFRVYAGNGGNAGIVTVNESLTIAAAATTDSATTIPAGAIILSVAVRVTTIIPTAATFTVTAATGGNTFNTAAVAVAANTTDQGTAAGALYTSAGTKVRITPNLTPGTATGVVRLAITYYLSTPPTS